MNDTRYEPIIDQIATIIQDGHIKGMTSYEIAVRINELTEDFWGCVYAT